MDLKIICWNIRGLNDLNGRDIVKKKVRDWKLSILLLQEAKFQLCTDLMAWQCWGNKHVKWIDSPSQGSSGGILFFWDSSKIEVSDFLMGPYSITLLCKTISSSFQWMFTGIYAPCASYTEDVKLFWREIEEVRSFWQYPWVIGGEFNEIRFCHERSTGSDYTCGMERLNKFISKHHLIDFPLIGATYTWTNNQVQSVRIRIDRLLVSLSWEMEFPNVIQKALPRPVSDHSPIALICDGNPGFVFFKKLQLLKPKLREWSKQEYGELERKLEDLEEIFNNLDIEENLQNGLTSAQWDERVVARKEWCRLTLVKAEKWRCKARVNDIKNNDNNTKYFHKLENDNRRRSYIGSIKVNDVLTANEEEIKHDFMKVLQDLQERSFLDWRLKNTFIALIPKKDTIEEIKDLRPISLVHGAYKILSKLLAERFKVSLPSVISQHQTTFIKKRQILDGVLIANELIDSRTRSGKPGLLCKVDFEKAFDHVNWDFIDEILKLMGYGDKWRSWVKCCVEFVKFSVLVNGSASGFFTSKKGIRQGDPLSPFLFLLVGEALYYILKQAQLQGLISGFQVSNEGMLISHLQSADNTLIFLDVDIEQVKNLRLILLSFELLTGLKINFSKTQIFGVGFDGDLSQFCDILRFYSGLLPTIYLGLPLGDKCRGVAKWDKIVDKFIAKLVGWKKKLLKRAVRFWEDNWLYDTYIKDCYPHLYNVSRSKNHKVVEMGVTEANGVVWNLRSPRRLFGAAAMEHAILVSDLASFTFTPDLEDELQWNLRASKVYSVKSLYDFLSVIDADTSEKPFFSFIWKQKYPPKIGFFLWTISHGRLPTRDSLRRKRMDVPADCLFCNEPETTAYVLLHCTFAKKI
ncbi:uncharacterized protein LOC113272434 [Papaver somniferum]|uniref:uncharacterized protein LOC113272434 n=1 Tax=Papaver somniferum TaxID=3469 RepID=UPI000E6FD150|nr:uncharacterized protein LOC113272434 [Papaver somniferum]